MKLFFALILTVLNCSIIHAQNKADLHYKLLDTAYKELGPNTQTDYLIYELEYFTFVFPNSAQEDEILFRLSNLYGLKNDSAQQLKTLIKLNILHGYSPFISRSVEVIDSLITFIPGLELTDHNEGTIRQLSIIPYQKVYRLAYLKYLSFLYSAKIKKIDGLLLLEITHYKKLFFSEHKDMDAVVFWQAEVFNREKNYPAAILNFNKICKLYGQSQFVPHALLELARLNRDYLKDFDQAGDYLIELINQYPDTKLPGDAQFELAELYEIHYKDSEEALTNYKLHINAFPKNKNHSAALLRISFISEQKGDYQEALNRYMQIIEDNGDANSVHTAFKNIIRLYMEKFDNFKLTIKTMVLYAQTFPKSDEAAKNLFSAGRLYLEKFQDADKAQKVFDLIHSQYPKSKYAKEVEKLLKN